jgi:hypothetical protein
MIQPKWNWKVPAGIFKIGWDFKQDGFCSSLFYFLNLNEIYQPFQVEQNKIDNLDSNGKIPSSI